MRLVIINSLVTSWMIIVGMVQSWFMTFACCILFRSWSGRCEIDVHILWRTNSNTHNRTNLVTMTSLHNVESAPACLSQVSTTTAVSSSGISNNNSHDRSASGAVIVSPFWGRCTMSNRQVYILKGEISLLTASLRRTPQQRWSSQQVSYLTCTDLTGWCFK